MSKLGCVNSVSSVPAAMQALELRELGCLELVQRPVPRPAPDEVLVQTLATTICTSDLNDISENPFDAPMPRILGHEGSGTVAVVGSEVSSFVPGQPVMGHPVVPCRECTSCRRGLEHLCQEMGHLGLDRGGTFAEYFCLRADRLRPIPLGVAPAVAALLEPVAVCLHALDRARIGRGETLMIVGDGPFGILTARLAARRGVGSVMLVGRHDFRMGYAPDAFTIHEQKTSSVSEVVRLQTDGEGADAAILCTGSPGAVEPALASLRRRGRLVVFSSVTQQVPLNLFRLHTRELEVLGACNDKQCIDEACACLADPTLRLAELITHRLPLVEWERAFDLAARGKDEAIKVALLMGEE